MIDKFLDYMKKQGWTVEMNENRDSACLNQ